MTIYEVGPRDGLQNEARDDGVTYAYGNHYAGGAATIGTGRALAMVPVMYVVLILLSRGCPFGCRFCDFRLMNRTDYKSLDILRDELRGLCSTGVTKIDFVDDLFTFPEERLQSICRMMLSTRSPPWLSPPVVV